MDILCTRPGCSRINSFADLDNRNTLQTAQQKFCTSCGMPLILGGRYLPVKLLGQGGFGAAFLALDRFTPTMRFCVVKQFQPAGDLSAAQIQVALGLFEREASVLEKLGNKHDQIPDLFAFFPLVVDNPRTGKSDQFFYLVQEFINGKNLEDELADRGPFSESEVLKVLEEMLKILTFVHDKGSIHRDIKPSNIMRDQEGTLFLLDFGAVKEIAVGSVPGGGSTGIYSMGFAPPEQMSGGQVYPATDLYALAITCLYLLTGRSAQELYDSYHNTWHWRQFAPQVSDRLAQVIDRLLLPTPRDRYQSAPETLAALNNNPPSPLNSPNPPSHSSTKIQGTAPPVPSPSGQIQSQSSPSFSTLELLGCAAFTGYASTLIWIATTSLFSSPGISMGLWGMMTGGLIFAQWGRIIEKLEMLVITGVSTVLFWFLPILYLKTPLVTSLFLSLSQSFPMLSTPFWGVIVLASFGALGLVAILSLFRLVYQLLRLLL